MAEPKSAENKAAEAASESLPPYQESAAGSSSRSQPAQASASSGPTIDSPFDFPPQEDGLPAYSQLHPIKKPLAIPQSRPDAAAPFLTAYSPVLLSHGITAPTWHSFVDTLSAFLSAKVSGRAISHAADIGKHLSAVPVSFGKGVGGHAASVGKSIKDQARRGNVLGVASGVVGGAVSLTVGTAMRAVGAAVSLPGTAISAAVQRPLTPRERAEAYVAVANRDWLRGRGLQAQLLDTLQLSGLVGLPGPGRLLDIAGAGKGKNAIGQLQSLEGFISELQVGAVADLELGANTLWLVVVQGGRIP